MTTFTTEDRLIAEQNGSVTINVEPIPFAGLITITESAPKNEPVAWTDGKGNYFDKNSFFPVDDLIPLYTHPAKTLTDEDIARVVHELNQKARTPERWVTAMKIGAETIIQLRDELAILRRAQEK
jgi:hypothetical protein